jgi:hypothetical protein
LDGGWFSVASWNFGRLEKYLIKFGRANPSGIGRGRPRYQRASAGVALVNKTRKKGVLVAE